MYTKLICKHDRFLINMFEPSCPIEIGLVAMDGMGNIVDYPVSG